MPVQHTLKLRPRAKLAIARPSASSVCSTARSFLHAHRLEPLDGAMHRDAGPTLDRKGVLAADVKRETWTSGGTGQLHLHGQPDRLRVIGDVICNERRKRGLIG